ncbi:SH3 domain-containing protein [Peptococcus niger]|uniref:SH3 domain-containing protein n=1 Tax=Peptococcus niger TaxID=2741 RepID=A0A1G6T4D2_PEPNI|nr:SH3 domain-containing protein [Peptococcus niger]SDD23327.1 SH3 domain-containing protein [Peptococcus niger]
MKVKNILIALAIAIVIGLALGSIIAYTSGALFGPKDPLVTTSSSDVDTSLVDASELENKQKKEARAKAEKAIADAKKQDNKTEQSKSSKKNSSNEGQAEQQAQQGTTQAAAPQQNQQQQASGGSATINVQGADLNMRAAADPSATIVGSVSNGTQVNVLERANGMVHIQTGDGRQAWVAEGYVNG